MQTLKLASHDSGQDNHWLFEKTIQASFIKRRDSKGNIAKGKYNQWKPAAKWTFSRRIHINLYLYIYIMSSLVAISPATMKMSSDHVELRTATLWFWRLSAQKTRHQRLLSLCWGPLWRFGSSLGWPLRSQIRILTAQCDGFNLPLSKLLGFSIRFCQS